MTEENGHFRCYVEKKFSTAVLDRLGKINALTQEYEAAGLKLTIRQIYYQFVSRGWAPSSPKTYDAVQSAVNDGRMAGLVSWTAIEDRGRALRGNRTYESPGDAIRGVAKSYKTDLWAGQRFVPEVWIEKEALSGVIEGICLNLRVNFFATKGYNSQSEQWAAGRRLAGYVAKGQTPVVLHLGDHDPSGVHMTQDNQERLSLFAGFNVAVERLALNMDQIIKYDPPPFDVKFADSRAYAYQQQYGDDCWELDALDPRVIVELISSKIATLRDERLWSEALAEEVSDRRALKEAADTFGGAPDPEDNDE